MAGGRGPHTSQIGHSPLLIKGIWPFDRVCLRAVDHRFDLDSPDDPREWQHPRAYYLSRQSYLSRFSSMGAERAHLSLDHEIEAFVGYDDHPLVGRHMDRVRAYYDSRSWLGVIAGWVWRNILPAGMTAAALSVATLGVALIYGDWARRRAKEGSTVDKGKSDGATGATEVTEDEDSMLRNTFVASGAGKGSGAKLGRKKDVPENRNAAAAAAGPGPIRGRGLSPSPRGRNRVTWAEDAAIPSLDDQMSQDWRQLPTDGDGPVEPRSLFISEEIQKTRRVSATSAQGLIARARQSRSSHTGQFHHEGAADFRPVDDDVRGYFELWGDVRGKISVDPAEALRARRRHGSS